jgi:hypothetical protein
MTQKPYITEGDGSHSSARAGEVLGKLGAGVQALGITNAMYWVALEQCKFILS